MPRSSQRTLNSRTEPAPLEPATDREAELEVGPVAPPEDDVGYGVRWVQETLPDGRVRGREVPLTYRDLLDPQEDDVVYQSTVHQEVVAELFKRLRQRYEDAPSVAVWNHLKILFDVPGLTAGPSPDLCVVSGVEDRQLRRPSFRLGEEPGELRLAIEVVSPSSIEKDYRDLIEIYSRMKVDEYLTVHPRGDYADGPYELRAWRRDAASGRLVQLAADRGGRFYLPTSGLVFGTGPGGWGLLVWDMATGERLLAPEEVEAARTRRAEKRAEEAEVRAGQAEERAWRAEAHAAAEERARRAAEERAAALEADLARLRRRDV